MSTFNFKNFVLGFKWRRRGQSFDKLCRHPGQKEYLQRRCQHIKHRKYSNFLYSSRKLVLFKVLAKYSYESFSDNMDAKFLAFQSNWRHHPIIMKRYILVYMFLDFGWEFVRICAMIFTTINWRVPVSKSFICWVRHLIEKINLLLAFTTAEHFIQKI